MLPQDETVTQDEMNEIDVTDEDGTRLTEVKIPPNAGNLEAVKMISMVLTTTEPGTRVVIKGAVFTGCYTPSKPIEYSCHWLSVFNTFNLVNFYYIDNMLLLQFLHQQPPLL